MFRKKALRINAYHGYGNQQCFRATGRALEDENISFSPSQNIFQTIWTIFKQLESDEIKYAPILIHLSNGDIIETQTDPEGYYNVEIPFTNTSSNNQKWITYSVSFDTKKIKGSISQQNNFGSQMLIPSTTAQFGVISDIDDTILHTGVASLFKWRLIANTIFKSLHKRTATKGMVSFYQKLQKGTQIVSENPFFYVSNSPWNLYDYLTFFIEKHKFPKGPILLRDFRTFLDKTPKPKLPHKESEILNLLKLYPNLSFILIGDSGEKDIDIYTKIATQYPKRILAIYLRSVPSKRKEKRTKKIMSSFDLVPIILIKSIEKAMVHAKKTGFIN